MREADGVSPSERGEKRLWLLREPKPADTASAQRPNLRAIQTLNRNRSSAMSPDVVSVYTL